jgi:DNA end-binding protein Ku
MNAIWNGMISFGLVNIPVGLYTATDERDLPLHLLHAKDHGRVKNQRICSVDGEVVEYEDIVKGYEYEKDKYVEITDDDLKKARPQASDRIVIDDFVDAGDIDPKLFERPYYLLPAKKSEASYALLREALAQSHKVGIARIVIRTKEQLAAVRVDGPMIMLDTMHFVDEIRKMDAPAAVTVGKREVDMALTLINAMTTKFEPEKYHDTYRDALLNVIEQKIDGKEIVAAEVHESPTEIIDLMAYLKRSVEQAEAKTMPSPETREKLSSPVQSPKRTRRKKAENVV